MVSLAVQTNAQGFHHSEVADHEKAQDAVVGSCPWTDSLKLQCTENDVQEGGILRERRRGGGREGLKAKRVLWEGMRCMQKGCFK